VVTERVGTCNKAPFLEGDQKGQRGREREREKQRNKFYYSYYYYFCLDFCSFTERKERKKKSLTKSHPQGALARRKY
jgi:hypothetical protein